MPQYARRRRQPGERLMALMGARNLQMNLPLTAITQPLMNACASPGSTGWNHSATLKALEQLVNFEIGQNSGHEELG